MKDSLSMVWEFHEAFGIKNPIEKRVPGIQNPDIQSWLYEEGESLITSSKRIKLACITLKNAGVDVTAMLRMQLMTEELGEVLVAMSRGDIKSVLHELADLRYVVDGTAWACGLGNVYREAIAEIHRANMSKLDENGKPVLDPSGRVAKSKLFKEADVSKLLEQV